MIEEDADLIFDETARLAKALDKVVKDFWEASSLYELRRVILLQSMLFAKINHINGIAAAIKLNTDDQFHFDLEDMETVGGKQ